MGLGIFDTDFSLFSGLCGTSVYTLNLVHNRAFIHVWTRNTAHVSDDRLLLEKTSVLRWALSARLRGDGYWITRDLDTQDPSRCLWNRL